MDRVFSFCYGGKVRKQRGLEMEVPRYDFVAQPNGIDRPINIGLDFAFKEAVSLAYKQRGERKELMEKLRKDGWIIVKPFLMSPRFHEKLCSMTKDCTDIEVLASFYEYTGDPEKGFYQEWIHFGIIFGNVLS